MSEVDVEKVEYLWNNSSVRERCPLCWHTFKPWIGEWPFLGGDYSRPLCEACADEAEKRWLERVADLRKKGEK